MVAHWNVRGIKTRRFDVEKFSERYDVLLLQETLLKPHDIYELPGFSLLRSDERRGILIAVRNRPGLSWRPIDCSAMCSTERDVQGVVVSDTRLTGDLHLYNVYVSRATAESDWEFLQQIESVGGHSVVAGDFNSRSPVWCCSRAHNANGQALEAVLQGVDLELVSLLRPTRLAERHGDADTTIDLCLVSPELIDRVSWRPAVHSGSDHLLCETRIAIPRSAAAASRPPRRPQLYPRRGAAIDVLDRLRRSADREARRRRQQGSAPARSSQPKWWTDLVNTRWTEKQLALRRWRTDRHSGNEITRSAARTEKNRTNALFKRAATVAYEECWDAYIESANNNTTMFWRFVSTLGGDQPNTSGLHIEHNGQLLRTEEQRGEAFLSRFIEQCSQQDLQERREARAELDAVIGAGAEPPAFTSQDLDDAIRRLSDTACGPDRLRAGDFRALSEEHRRSLLADINASIASGTVPAHWTDSFLVPIPKPGKDHRSLGGYRVITVQNMGGKLVEGMLTRRLSAALDAFLPPTLGAYRSGRATWLNVGQVVHKAYEAFENREHALIVCLDLQDAYNLVSIPILVRRLRSLGIDPYLVRWLLQSFQARRCALRSGRWLSDWRTVTMALPQGSPLSPVCFNVYTLPLATMSVPPNFTIFTFADDVLVCGTGGSLPDVATQMQGVLDDVQAICHEASMEINPAKAVACVLSLSKSVLPAPLLRYDGQLIRVDETITHLGVTLDRRLTFSEHIAKTTTRCLRTLGTLKSAQKRGLSQQRMFTLYRSLILSRLSYGGEVVTACPTTLEKLDRVQTAALRIITGCTRDTSRAALRYMLDISSVPEQLQSQRVFAVTRAGEDSSHPLCDTVRSLTRRAPLRRLARPGWVRQACDTVRELRGRNQLRNQPQFMCTPPDVASRWTIICRHSMDRACRDWAPGVANAEFEALLESLVDQHRTALILATDGSVISEPPRTGWGAYLRSDGCVRRSSGACRLVLSSLRAELEAVTLGLTESQELLRDADLLVVVTDSQSLLSRLEAGWSPPEWWDMARVETVWVYCPGHAGIDLNETADRLASRASGAISRIALSAFDIRHLLRQKQRETQALVSHGSTEVERMHGRGLERGWVRRSRRSGATGRLACQLACGTISRRTLADICRTGDAETAWARCFGPRPSARLPPKK